MSRDSHMTITHSYALTISVCTFLMDVTKGKAKFDSSLTERNISFTRPEVNKRKIGKTKKLSKCGHNFQLMTYNRATYCDHCERLLWGITYQGYQCNSKFIRLDGSDLLPVGGQVTWRRFDWSIVAVRYKPSTIFVV